MKLQRRQITLACVALVLLALGFGVWWLHYRPKRELADYKRQLIAAGEKLTIEELIPKPVPPEQNSAEVFLKGVSLVNKPPGLLNTNAPHAMTMVAPGKVMVGWKQPDIRDYYEAKTTNTWAEAEAALADLAEAFELLQQLIEKPTMDFRLNYQQGFSMSFPNLAATKVTVQRLSAAALCDLHRGATASAVKQIRTMLALSKGSADERLVISQLVRFAITAITVTANWELLQSPDITDDQLAALQRDWTELDFIQATENALGMERAMSQMTVAQMRNSSAGFNKVVAGHAWGRVLNPPSAPSNWYEEAEQFTKDAWDKTKLKSKEAAWRLAWSYPDQLRAMKGQEVVLESLRSVLTNQCFDTAIRGQQSRLDALGIQENSHDDMLGGLAGDLDLRSLLSESVLSLTKVVKRLMSIEVSRQMMITAIALKRHQLRHGNYPVDLVSLIPEFLASVPRDPVDGQPLRYRREGEKSFLLYSVGEDAEDNGGDPKPANEKSESRYWLRGRDWVWPQPASAQEVEVYYESIAKKHPPAAPNVSANTNSSAEQQAFVQRYGLENTNAPIVQTNVASPGAVK